MMLRNKSGNLQIKNKSRNSKSPYNDRKTSGTKKIIHETFRKVYTDNRAEMNRFDMRDVCNVYMVICGIRPSAILQNVSTSDTSVRLKCILALFDAFPELIELKIYNNEDATSTSHVGLFIYNTKIINRSTSMKHDFQTYSSAMDSRKDMDMSDHAALGRLLGYRCTDGFPCHGNTIVSYDIRDTARKDRIQLFGYCCTDAEIKNNQNEIYEYKDILQNAFDASLGADQIQVSVNMFKSK